MLNTILYEKERPISDHKSTQASLRFDWDTVTPDVLSPKPHWSTHGKEAQVRHKVTNTHAGPLKDDAPAGAFPVKPRRPRCRHVEGIGAVKQFCCGGGSTEACSRAPLALTEVELVCLY